MAKNTNLLREILVRQTTVPTLDAIAATEDMSPEVAERHLATLKTERDYRPIPFMPKGSKSGVYGVPVKYREVLGCKEITVRWTSYRDSKPYPMFEVDGCKVRKRDEKTNEHTEAYRRIRIAFAEGIIPLKPKAAKAKVGTKADGEFVF
jgi:hypothetical protein